MLIETENKKDKDGKDVRILTGNTGSSQPVNRETVERVRNMYHEDNENQEDKGV